MGFRFRKSFKIAPGVKLNINKKSFGLTIGKRGAHYTINSKGKRTTSIGIPGTGLSYTSTCGGRKKKKVKRGRTQIWAARIALVLFLAAILGNIIYSLIENL